MTRPNHRDRLEAERLVRHAARLHGLDTDLEPKVDLERPRPRATRRAQVLAGALLALPVVSLGAAGFYTVQGSWWALPATCLLWSGVMAILASIAGSSRR